eukprot:1013502_1
MTIQQCERRVLILYSTRHGKCPSHIGGRTHCPIISNLKPDGTQFTLAVLNEEVVMRYLMETVDACYDEDMTRILNAVDRYTYNKDMELICFCNGSVDPDVQ